MPLHRFALTCITCALCLACSGPNHPPECLGPYDGERIEPAFLEPCQLALGAAGIVEARILDWTCPRSVSRASGSFPGSGLDVEITRALKGDYAGRIELVAAYGINSEGESLYGQFIRGSSAYLLFYEELGDLRAVPPAKPQVLLDEGFYWGAGSGTVWNNARYRSGLPEVDFIAQAERGICPDVGDAGAGADAGTDGGP